MAGTTSVTIFEDTFIQTGGWFHLPTSTDELALHQAPLLQVLNEHFYYKWVGPWCSAPNMTCPSLSRIMTLIPTTEMSLNKAPSKFAI